MTLLLVQALRKLRFNMMLYYHSQGSKVSTRVMGERGDALGEKEGEGATISRRLAQGDGDLGRPEGLLCLFQKHPGCLLPFGVIRFGSGTCSSFLPRVATTVCSASPSWPQWVGFQGHGGGGMVCEFVCVSETWRVHWSLWRLLVAVWWCRARQ